MASLGIFACFYVLCQGLLESYLQNIGLYHETCQNLIFLKSFSIFVKFISTQIICAHINCNIKMTSSAPIQMSKILGGHSSNNKHIFYKYFVCL